MKIKLKTLVVGLALMIPALSKADQIFGDFKRLPDDIERGFSIGADFGLFELTGSQKARRTAQNPGSN